MPQTLNPYAYGVNGPLAYPDPYGEFPPALAVVAPIAGRLALAVAADYAFNAAVSGVHYMVTRPEDKPFDWSDFASTVGGEALDLTIADLKNPAYLLSPMHKYDKIGDIYGFAKKAGNYAPNRPLPRAKHGYPVPDGEFPHTQLGRRTNNGHTYTQGREWTYDENGRLTATRDLDFTYHGTPDIHPNPHQHTLTPNNPNNVPKGGYRRGGPEELMYPQ